MNPAPPVMTVLNVGTPDDSSWIGFPVSRDHFLRILAYDNPAPYLGNRGSGRLGPIEAEDRPALNGNGRTNPACLATRGGLN